MSGLSFSPGFAQAHDEQQHARKEMRSGTLMPLREIEQKILPQMAGHEYLGPSYDPAAMAYRLKFIRSGKVVFLDVDARTGKVLARSR
nr:PepSY domain-containing protein [Altericroceibacterium xinjiangense]